MKLAFKRGALILFLILCVPVGFHCLNRYDDKKQIENLYLEMQKRISKNDAKAMSELFSPKYRSANAETNIFILHGRFGAGDFELNKKSDITFSGKSAELIVGEGSQKKPSRIGLGLEKIEGHWYFTGKTTLHLDRY